MAEYKHGTMDCEDQKKTYNAFITFVSRASMAIIGILVFLALFAL